MVAAAAAAVFAVEKVGILSRERKQIRSALASEHSTAKAIYPSKGAQHRC